MLTVVMCVSAFFVGIILSVTGLVVARLYYNADILKDWQPLFVGILALLAAIGTIGMMQLQIRATERRHLDERFRRGRAARAVLPLALSTIGHFAQECMTFLVRNRLAIQAHTPIVDPKPEFPSDIIQPIKESIEFADDGPAATLAKLLREMQVHNARFTGLLADADRRRLSILDVNQALMDAAKIYALVARHFEYARMESEDAPKPIDGDAVRSALFVNRIHREEYPDLFDMVTRRERHIGN